MRRFLVVLALLLLLPAAAMACSCASATDEQLLERSDLVFEGEVTDVSLRYWRVAVSTIQSFFGVDEREDYERRRGIEVEFAVERRWKGSAGAYTEIFTGRGDGDCGYRFQQGTKYVVFASRSPEGELRTSLCERPAPVAEASETIANLERVAREAAAAP